MKDDLILDDLFQGSYRRVHLILQFFACFVVFLDRMMVFDLVDHLRNFQDRSILAFLHFQAEILFSDLDQFYHLTFAALN